MIDRLEELVLKPVDGAGGKGLAIGPAATAERLAEVRAQTLHDPRGWIAPVVQLTTVPTLIDGRLRPRHVDLRPFAVNDGRDVWVLPGGLTRVARPEGQLVVNSSQGGGSKDTWVLSGARTLVSVQRMRMPTRHLSLPHPDLGPDDDSNSNRRRRVVSHAEPDRGVAVLDRALRGARRRHRADPRRPAADAGGGPADALAWA